MVRPLRRHYYFLADATYNSFRDGHWSSYTAILLPPSCCEDCTGRVECLTLESYPRTCQVRIDWFIPKFRFNSPSPQNQYIKVTAKPPANWNCIPILYEEDRCDLELEFFILTELEVKDFDVWRK